jgi:hypothetical protein
MALDRERQVLGCHANAIVRNADQALSATPEGHVDLAGASVYGILDEFLHHARRAFDHLARRDAVHRSF